MGSAIRYQLRLSDEQTLWSDSNHGRYTMRIESEYWIRELQLEAWMDRPRPHPDPDSRTEKRGWRWLAERVDASGHLDRHRGTPSLSMGFFAVVNSIDYKVDVSWMVEIENRMKE